MDYKEFYERVGKEIGWDFSRVKTISEGEKWDFYDVVSAKLKKTDLWLDLASGSGERLIHYAPKSLLLVASDFTAGMIEKAKDNIGKIGHSNIRFLKIDAYNKIDFPDDFFDIISVRHSHFNSSEVARILKPNGLFLTQQVEYKDKENFVSYFGRHQCENSTNLLARRYAEELTQLKFSEVIIDEYDADEYYEGYEDVLFFLKNTPVVPDFGKFEDDFKALDRFIKDNSTEKGIKTNSHRSILIARK